MKALVYTDLKTLTYCDMPDPASQDGEVLVRVSIAGICGSDMHAFLGHDERRPAPLILGHEAAGVIAEGEHAGQRVTINPLVTCGKCRYCKSGRTNLCPQREIISMQPRQGAFAQLVSVPPENLVFVPDHIPLEKAVLAEPLACGWHAVRLAQEALDTPLKQARCVVIGGGAIGVGAALSLAAFGADNITLLEPNVLRHEKLAQMDSFSVCDPSGTDAPEPVDADIIVDAVGLAATRATACSLVRPGGIIVHIGLGDNQSGLDVRRMTLQEICFIGTYTYTTQDFADTANAIFNQKLGELNWTEQRPLSKGHEAFVDLLSGKVAAPKILLTPDRASCG